MLPRKYRLPRSEIGENFYKIFSSAYFLVKSRPNSLGINRFAVIIPIRAVPTSVRRHFFKRFFSRYVVEWQNIGKDFIIILSPGVMTATKADVRSEINRAAASI